MWNSFSQNFALTRQPNTLFSGFGKCGADQTTNETACKRANHSENAPISQTPLQLMFGGCRIINR